MDDGLLVRVHYASTSSFVVTPHGKKFGGEMVVRIAFDFENEGYLLCCDMFLKVEYMKEFLPH